MGFLDFHSFNGFRSLQGLNLATLWVFIQRTAHGGYMSRGRTTAAPHDAGTRFTKSQGILTKILRVSRVHDAPTDLLRPPGVGFDPEKRQIPFAVYRNGLSHVFDQAQQLSRTSRTVDSNHICTSRNQLSGNSLGCISQDCKVIPGKGHRSD